MKNSSLYNVSTTTRPGKDAPVYAIKVTTNDGTSGFVIGPDGDAMFFADKSEARAKLRELQKDDRYSWNCEAECVCSRGGRRANPPSLRHRPVNDILQRDHAEAIRG